MPSRLLPTHYLLILSSTIFPNTTIIDPSTQEIYQYMKKSQEVINDDSKQQKMYCICRKAERPGMIGCDNCDEWYHTDCLGFSKTDIKRVKKEDWSCPSCKKGKNKFYLSVMNS